MRKSLILIFFALMSFNALAESACDVRPGISVGIKVVEFASGNVVHSKIPMRESNADSLLEEMISLQDMGICTEKITSQKCTLKFEKIAKTNYISLYRGPHKWNTWHLKSKNTVQELVKNLKRTGFCS
jgi:hypothetical protein